MRFFNFFSHKRRLVNLGARTDFAGLRADQVGHLDGDRQTRLPWKFSLGGASPERQAYSLAARASLPKEYATTFAASSTCTSARTASASCVYRVGHVGVVAKEMQGTGKTYYATGKLMYEGEYKDGTMHGTGKMYYETGEIAYDGAWKEDEVHGKGDSYRVSGTL
jgi:hypothetical protein